MGFHLVSKQEQKLDSTTAKQEKTFIEFKEEFPDIKMSPSTF